MQSTQGARHYHWHIGYFVPAGYRVIDYVPFTSLDACLAAIKRMPWAKYEQPEPRRHEVENCEKCLNAKATKMQTKITAGSWRIFKHTNGLVEVGTNQRKIAVMPWCEAPCAVDPEDEANARAIAAVPELIEACLSLRTEREIAIQEVQNATSDLDIATSNGIVFGLDIAIEAVQAALAKAGV